MAAASQLQGAGQVLLADRGLLGTGASSACGTLLAVLERLDALDALEQIHPTVTINAAGRRVTFRPALHVRHLQLPDAVHHPGRPPRRRRGPVAPFEDREPGGTLVFGDRRVQAPVVVDASGWRALVARESGGPAAPDRGRLSYGLEARHGHGGARSSSGHGPQAARRSAVAFPAGAHSGREWHPLGDPVRGSRPSGLRASRTRRAAPAVHSGFFPARLGDPFAGDVFVVGDAAGQCLPLTGEGIRPALVRGMPASQIRSAPGWRGPGRGRRLGTEARRSISPNGGTSCFGESRRRRR